MAEEESKNIILYDNVMTKGYFLTKPIRNWIEGSCFGFLFMLLVTLIPFVRAVKILMMIIVFIAVFVACVVGMKNRSYTQILVAFIKHSRNKKRLHLRTPDYIRNVNYEEVENESIAETALRKGKEGLDSFVEKYRTK